MSTATLNVYVTELGQPCTISNRTWVVNVAHCDGTLLNWSEGRYRQRSEDPWTNIAQHVPPHDAATPPLPAGSYYDSIPARNGHVEIEVPPGCYVLIGSMHVWFTHGILVGNWYTDHAIVQASCQKDVCVTLYAPTAMRCHYPLFEFVLPLLMQHGVVKREPAQQAVEAIRGLARLLPISPFEQEEQQLLRGAFQAMAHEGGKDSR